MNPPSTFLGVRCLRRACGACIAFSLTWLGACGPQSNPQGSPGSSAIEVPLATGTDTGVVEDSNDDPLDGLFGRVQQLAGVCWEQSAPAPVVAAQAEPRRIGGYAYLGVQDLFFVLSTGGGTSCAEPLRDPDTSSGGGHQNDYIVHIPRSKLAPGTFRSHDVTIECRDFLWSNHDDGDVEEGELGQLSDTELVIEEIDIDESTGKGRIVGRVSNEDCGTHSFAIRTCVRC